MFQLKYKFLRLRRREVLKPGTYEARIHDVRKDKQGNADIILTDVKEVKNARVTG